MFRRLPASLPKEPEFKASLKDLGYFINDKSQIMQIKHPDQGYAFKITTDERYNIMHREALNVCIREEVNNCVIDAGLSMLYLPQLTTDKPDAPYVPIFTTPQAELKTKKRIIIVSNDHKQDLGIWDYRCVSLHGIDAGSCVDLIKALDHDAEENGIEAPGLIISNPGQLTYSHKYNRVMTTQSWQSMPRSSLVHPVVQEHAIHNTAEGNRDKTEHLTFIFEKILKNANWARQDAQIYVIGILNGGEVALTYLNKNWDFWNSRVAAIALTSVFKQRQTLSWEMIQFLRDRARNWKISSAPKDACLVSPLHWTLQIPDTEIAAEVLEKAQAQAPEKVVAAKMNENGELTEWAADETTTTIPDPQIICPEFSSTVEDFTEVIFPTVIGSVLAFFKDVGEDEKGYKNPALTVHEWDPEVVEAQIPELEDSVKVVEKDVEIMTLEEFEKQEKDGETNEAPKKTDEGKESKMSEVHVNGAVEQSNSTAKPTANEATDTTLNSLGSHAAEASTSDATATGTRVAGVNLDEETLKAAGLI